MKDEHGMRLAYVVGEFPSLTENFILKEVLEMSRTGMDPVVFSIRKGKISPRPDHKGSLAQIEIVVCRPWSSVYRWMRFCYHLARRPISLLRAGRVMMEGMADNPMAVMRGLRNWLQAIDLMDRAPALEHVHAHFANMPTETGLLLATLLNRPFSFSAHAYDLFVEGRKLDWKLSHSRFMVTCTHYNKQFLEQNVEPEYHERIHAIYHGIDPNDWVFRSSLPHSDEFTIITVARLVPKKGIEVAFSALDYLDHSPGKINYVIVGDGPERMALEQMSKTLRCVKVTFTGELSHEELRIIYATADVLVHPGVVAGNGDRDGIPNVLLEAMASGVPVIASDISAIPELVQHFETGILVPSERPDILAKALVTLMEDPGLRFRLAHQAYARVESMFHINQATLMLRKLFVGAEL